MTDLSGRVAVVTGASRGIGRDIAHALARAGAVVACVATSRENAAPTAAAIRQAGGTARAYGCRIERLAEVQALFQALTAELGAPEILVNNAAVTTPASLLEFREEDFDTVIGVNVKGLIFCSQQAALAMREHGRGGAIVHIGSFSGITAFPRRMYYGTSKAAVNHLTKQMAIELAEYDIRVNQVVPGYIRTEMSDMLASQGATDPAAMQARIPQHRLGAGQDVAEAVLYLAGAGSAYVTGATINVDGGYLAYGFL